MGFDFGKAINDLLPIVAVGGGLYLAYRMLFGDKTASTSGIVSSVGKSLGESVSEIPAVGENLVESFREGVYGYPFDKILAHEDFVSKGFTLDSLINPQNYRIYDAEAQTYQDNLSRMDLVGVLGPLNDKYLFKDTLVVTTPSGKIETYDGLSGKLIETPTVQRATKSSSSSSSSGGSSGGSGYGKAKVVDKQTGRVSPDIRSPPGAFSGFYGN